MHARLRPCPPAGLLVAGSGLRLRLPQLPQRPLHWRHWSGPPCQCPRTSDPSEELHALHAHLTPRPLLLDACTAAPRSLYNTTAACPRAGHRKPLCTTPSQSHSQSQSFIECTTSLLYHGLTSQPWPFAYAGSCFAKNSLDAMHTYTVCRLCTHVAIAPWPRHRAAQADSCATY